MCGIVGGAFYRGGDVAERMPAALERLNHRGPDDKGFNVYRNGQSTIALGHTRLSIIDLSNAGHQPMHTSDGRYSIVFNGEIYNYKEIRKDLQDLGSYFKTESDTEVLLVAWSTWGKQCLRKLIGMFSFVIYDNKSEVLTCVRDQFGIKPFLYAEDGESFVFASDASALLKLKDNKPTLNLQRAYDYLVYGQSDTTTETFFSGICNLLPGHLIEVSVRSFEKVKPVRWWNPNIKEHEGWTFDQAVEQVRAQFLNSIRLHMRSDVPLGAALSGGIDSSAVVCAMRYLEPEAPIHTFSYIAKDSDLSEEAWIDMVNEHVGAVSHKVVVSKDELASDLDSMILSQGEPFGSTSIYAQYRVFQMAHETGITVTLDGQGADEMLAGYDGYPGPRLRSLLEEGELSAALNFIKGWSSFPGRSRLDALKKLVGECTTGTLYNSLRWLNGTGSVPDWINKNVLQAEGVNLSPPRTRPTQTARGRRLVAQLGHSLTISGLPALLRYGDRNSMYYSIESRVPFLTTNMVDLMLSMPEEYLVSRTGKTKYVFREAMRGIVPDEILDRKDKIGFATPERDLLLTNPGLFESWLMEDLELPFLDQEKMLDRFRNIVQGSEAFTSQVWRWVNFSRWYKLKFQEEGCNC